MPDMNTIAYQSNAPGQNGIAPNTNAQTTTETAVSLNANAFAAAAGITLGGGVIPLSVPAASQAVGYSNIVADIWNLGRPFLVECFGTVTTGTSLNGTLKLYQVPASILAAGTQATLANNNSLGSSGAVAMNTTSTNYWMQARLQWDSTSKKLTGTIKFSFSGTIVAEAEISVQTTATASDNELNFILSWTFSAANAANVNQVQFFEIKQA